MNANIDDPEYNAGGMPPSDGRIPSGAHAAALHERVAAVMRVLDAARQDAEGALPNRVLSAYRPALAEVMVALGGALADFLDESPLPVDLARLRTEFLDPILAISRTLPIFRRVEAWAAHHGETSELHRLVLEGRPLGFDVPSTLLDDFYQRGGAAPSLRTRATGLMKLLHEELANDGGLNGRPVRALVLGAHSVLALNFAFAEPELLSTLVVLIVDEDGAALRRARQQMEDAFGIRPAVLLANPLALADHPSRPTDLFDIVYGFAAYDVLSFDQALAFTQSIAPFLRPGGALLTGSLLPQIPRYDRANLVALAGVQWEYWDEAKWRDMLARLPFDLEASQFATYPPATLTVLARRRSEEDV